MKYRLLLLFIVASFSLFTNLYSEQLIAVFLRPYPRLDPDQKVTKIMKSVRHAGKFSRMQVKQLLGLKKMVAGVFATYAGFLSVSNTDGEIAFPRKHTDPQLYILVTEELVPIVRSGNTLSHWELNEDRPAVMYQITKTKDENGPLEYYETAASSLPANNVVPLESIVIFANPRYVYIPLGVTPSTESPHLVLPDIYINHRINLTSPALHVLNVMHYYGALTFIVQKEPLRYRMLLSH